ncbi:tyrosine-type recombinase/integrase [Sanguibacter sp. Leaf3]|uniref:tyrosine-type recombinase/integrase n=1 Tax=Sanguibacter sp. Leaf3 TaxID=1736209 RepID=UPI0006FE52F5|nr:tyrosine-type recombinase/integrase [Sanguibacter sp. Leaf3]KQT98361.1 hypothetical protein ASG53_11920 [Sanguibacter sp. Leaf3]
MHEGKRVRKRFVDEEDARNWYRDRVGQAIGYGAAPIDPIRELTLTDWLRTWMQAVYDDVAAGRRAQTTAEFYDGMCRLHIVPYLGHLRLTSMTAENIRAWLRDDLPAATFTRGAKGSSRPLSEGTQAGAAKTLRAALGAAVRESRVTGLKVSPFTGVSIPSVRRGRSITPGSYRSKAIPIRDRKKLRDFVVERGCSHGAGFCEARIRLGLEVGLRQGEVLGLLLTDMNLKSRRLEVGHHLQRQTWRHGCEDTADGWSCGEVKGLTCPQRQDGGLVLLPGTKAGSDATRSMILPVSLWDALVRHRKALLQETRGVPDPEQGKLLFRTTSNEAIGKERDYAGFVRLCEEAGVARYNPHAMRHTAATVLADTGQLDISVISALLGHASIDVTMGYVHPGARSVERALAVGVGVWDELSENDLPEDVEEEPWAVDERDTDDEL